VVHALQKDKFAINKNIPAKIIFFIRASLSFFLEKVHKENITGFSFRQYYFQHAEIQRTSIRKGFAKKL
jgi:hypothetical protein